MRNFLLRTCIYRLEGGQKVTVYKMPVFDYIIKLLESLYFLSFIIIVPWIIAYSRGYARRNKSVAKETPQ